MKTINSWVINVEWSDGEKERLTEVPDHIADYIDEWLSELEVERKNEETK